MNRQDLLNSLHAFGASADECCLHTLGVHADAIRETVLLSPGWKPELMFEETELREITSATPLFKYQIEEVRLDAASTATYIRAGYGAPAVMDLVLLLGLTPCRRLVFVSSVGAIVPEIGVGDLVIPAVCVSGDGASRYLSDDPTCDTFGEEQRPNEALARLLRDETARIGADKGVKWHTGRTFCTDTIIAQYPHLPHIAAQGYNTLDMESAAAFKAARLMGMACAALLNVSDNSVKDRSLLTQRSEEERHYRRFVRREVMAAVLRAALGTGNQKILPDVQRKPLL